jgi:hypothetical protein
LLYKSTDSREKDEADFRCVLADLDTAQRRWLGASLEMTSPLHPWLILL